MDSLSCEFFQELFPIEKVESFKYEELKQEQVPGTSLCYFVNVMLRNGDKLKEVHLFAKLQLPNSEDKERLMNVCEREELHYKVLLNPDHFEELNAQHTNPNCFYLPKLYYSSCLPNSSSKLFLFEDLRDGGWTCGNQLTGCDIQTAELVLSSIALHHARWWNTPIKTLEEKYKILYNLDYISTPMAMSSFFESVYPSFIEKFKDRLQIDDMETKFQLLSEAIVPILEYFTDRDQTPKTIVHGDLRLDNLFFRNGNELSIIDWQLSHSSHCVRDLGKFIILNVNASFDEQNSLLRFYYQKLRSFVDLNDDLTEEKFLHDFRLFSYIIVVSAILAWNTLCDGAPPSSLDYLVNQARLQDLYASWIDRIVIYLNSENFFEESDRLALNVREYDEFLSSKYSKYEEEHQQSEVKTFSKIVIAVKPWEDPAPWNIIHQSIIKYQSDHPDNGLTKWINMGDQPLLGKGQFGVSIAKYTAIVDNSIFSIDSFISDLEDCLNEFVQRVEMISSDDYKEENGNISSE